MRKESQYRRLWFMALLLTLAFAGLGYRLVDLQVLRHDTLAKAASDQTHHVYQLEARRGDIYDSGMRLLATSMFVKTVCADPVAIGGKQAEVAHALAPLLKMNEEELLQRLSPRISYNEKHEAVTNHYVVLKKKVMPDDWQKIHDLMADLERAPNEKNLPKTVQAALRNLRESAIFTDTVDDQLRSYPNGNLAAQVLGFVGAINHTNNGVVTSEITGVDGIEHSFNDEMKGVRGWRTTEVDGQKRELVEWRVEDVKPRDGHSIVLTIDPVIQHIARDALFAGMQKDSPSNACCIVVRPKTGQVLAMVTLPDYDPNHLELSTPESRRNRAIADQNEPGSTFKTVVISSAFDDGIVTPEQKFFCGHGVFIFEGRALHDHEPLDDLTVEQIITKSSNIGAAKIGILMGKDRLYQHLLDFGFNEPTGISLPGEIPGRVNSLKEWGTIGVAQVPMGQGVAVTSLQMTMAICAIANGGVLMHPIIVDRILDADGKVVARNEPHAVRRVIGEKADREMVAAMKTVTMPGGTGPQAAMAHYKAAGKTGTAQIPPYSSGRYFASFIGFFPADNPQVCIYVSMFAPNVHLHQGGQVSAPVFKDIAEKVASYLNIPPDDQIVPANVEVTSRPGIMGQISGAVHVTPP